MMLYYGRREDKKNKSLNGSPEFVVEIDKNDIISLTI